MPIEGNLDHWNVNTSTAKGIIDHWDVYTMTSEGSDRPGREVDTRITEGLTDLWEVDTGKYRDH